MGTVPLASPASEAAGMAVKQDKAKGCCLLATIWRPSTKSWGHHWSCFQDATPAIACAAVFRVVSLQVKTSHKKQYSSRTAFILVYSNAETGPKTLRRCQVILVLVFCLYWYIRRGLECLLLLPVLFKNKWKKTILSTKLEKGWLTWPLQLFMSLEVSCLVYSGSHSLRRYPFSSEMHLNWNPHHGQLYTGGKKQAASIKWFISLQAAYLGPESIVLAVPLSVIAQRVQLVLGRLPADLSFCSTLGFPFWLMKPHVTIISPASVKGCLLQLPLCISLLCFSFDLLLKHATPSRQKQTSMSFFDLHPRVLMRRVSLHYIMLWPNPLCM